LPFLEVTLVSDLIVRRAAPTYMYCVNTPASQISPTFYFPSNAFWFRAM